MIWRGAPLIKNPNRIGRIIILSNAASIVRQGGFLCQLYWQDAIKTGEVAIDGLAYFDFRLSLGLRVHHTSWKGWAPRPESIASYPCQFDC